MAQPGPVRRRKAWRAALKAAGLPRERLFHDLRRSTARNLRRAGASETEAMKVTGHKTPSMFRRYSIVTDDEAASALLRVDEAVLTSGAHPIGSAFTKPAPVASSDWRKRVGIESKMCLRTVRMGRMEAAFPPLAHLTRRTDRTGHENWAARVDEKNLCPRCELHPEKRTDNSVP